MTRVFDPETLAEIARLGVGLPRDAMFRAVHEALRERYPRHIDPEIRWVFNNAGGAMGQMTILHASLSEYLIFFGTPIGTEGHSGRYRTEVWDYMLDGEMWCYVLGETERSMYRPGEYAYLGKNQVKGYRIPDFAWMLEYARGPIPTMLPFGMADTVFSTVDYKGFVRTLWLYGRLVVRELLQGKV
jgi:hypothetical protein